ncbi:sensor histidine kinase [Clostridium estertheticum]|uniref:sensor histidine kinase n=1 Tax=Clostridium estertheticum TaxID=238834 RepID=UPI001C7D9049|nr:HAMP domain-containing sensor histidine kinase [Clostridium estertheticum]MBX4266684.1 HAMP domain-containing histidine kinase [Clostridium estertheticum]MBX4271233.1 HAMP domain-containing histidine kinase [Clostridium estertheticum]WLC81054.1 HAMP domain-containing histidine kinase [Clostridium estertheticum]WLC88194.1 HAMP domain-containing histidine kinase [Clostridium estertheticum]
MSIKVRLRISYMAMLIVPIILFLIALPIVASFYVKNIDRAYDIKYDGHPLQSTMFKGNPFKDLINKNSLILMGIEKAIEANPNILENTNYLSNLDSKLKLTHSGIVIRKNGNITYSTDFINKTAIKDSLPKFGYGKENEFTHNLMLNNLMISKQHDFYFKDKSIGSIFIITDAGAMLTITKSFFFVYIIVVILIMLLINGLLTYWVSKRIVTPIIALKNASTKIKEGYLDFEVESSANDEIGELYKEFEDMRCRLKESVELQLQYEDNRKELISNISHDLKTPVTAIKGYVEGIRDGVADTPEKMEKYINTIYKKTRDIDKMIDELFLFSKLDLNKLTFDFEKVDIKSYLSDIIDELKFDLEGSNIDMILIDEAKDKTAIVADREKLRRVIINIVQNSVKYMDKENGTIQIILKELGGNVQLEIKDNGPGISKAALSFIFDRFYRADPSRNSRTGGNGLGLAIAKSIIEGHEGEIWAESTVGLGTSIFFIIKKCIKEGSELI